VSIAPFMMKALYCRKGALQKFKLLKLAKFYTTAKCVFAVTIERPRMT